MTTYKTAVIKCYRCRKRGRNLQFWNVEYIAGLEVGCLCPECQTAEEDLGAEVNLAMGATHKMQTATIEATGGVKSFIYRLIDLYPTAALMRSKAERLAAARSDQMATEMVRLMRRIADDMESGELQ